LALSFLAACFALGIGLRGWLHRRRYGDNVLAAGLGRKVGTKAWYVGQLTGMGFLLLVLSPVLSITRTLAPLSALDATAAKIAGVATFLAGFALTQWAANEMAEVWRVSVDTTEKVRLVTSGPFAIVRNPIYSGLIVTMVGVVLMVPNPVALAGVFTLALSLELQVRLLEEPYLDALNSETFDAYAIGVGRFLPGVGRRHPTA
jgi:protein-S-isoprenylcysteine O-methyltransferase Ste14